MGIRSLRFRLLSAAAVTTLIALILAGAGLVALFGNHLERRFDAELDIYLNQLIARTDVDEKGRIHVTPGFGDPRFEEPLSGLYWQVQDDSGGVLLRSRSLWDTIIKLPEDKLSIGDVHHHILPGPPGQTLIVSERQVILLPESRALRLRVAAARDREDLDMARQAFAGDMLPYFALLAIILMIASWVQVNVGLGPLELVRRGVLSIRNGKKHRLRDPYPDELMPLVDEINELLEARDETVEKARSWTADLAHGLKTPLSVLGTDAQRLRQIGQSEMAKNLDELAETMRQRVDRELIRARLRSASAAGPQLADLVKVINLVVKTLARTEQGERLNWVLQAPESVSVAIREDDLTELLGNLLDNAGKWANGKVQITVTVDDGVELLIEDDGVGVSEEQLECLGERGLRLDQSTHGHGLGLAIAHDIIEAYDSTIEFSRSSLGGLAVKMLLHSV